MSETVDAEYQRLNTLTQFFTCHGWKMFKEMVEELIFIEECAKNKIMQEAVNENRLQELNFCLGKEKAYKTVLALKEELLGEPEEKENSPSPV